MAGSSDQQIESLLSRLAGRSTSDAPDPLADLAATTPDHTTVPAGVEKTSEGPRLRAAADKTLDSILARINSLPGPAASAGGNGPPEQETDGDPGGQAADGGGFVPLQPTDFQSAQLTTSEVEGLILKLLLSRGDASGRQIAEKLCLPFLLLDQFLWQLKNDQLVAHRGSAPMNDYLYQLTEIGRERARRLAAHCTYYGAAPVSLEDYIAGVQAQSLTNQRPSRADLQRAFCDLVVNDDMLARLGPAINSGRGLFLYGAAGNGKTSIAERVTKAFGEYIWIPRALGVDGEIIRLFDPMNHDEAPAKASEGLWNQDQIDKRWVRIRRPTIIVGGELTMDNLEVMLNTSTGISEAPVQLKSNCGTLVIDDFGRQRISTQELLNRWIVPLEKRIDYLNLANGRKIQVPFDQLVVFSTNLEPKSLVDEAFLRRIPYKVEVRDPSETEYRGLFLELAKNLECQCGEDVIDYLIDKHYRQTKRPLRYCQPRDILLQVRNYCRYNKTTLTATRETIDFAVSTYFAVM